MRTAIRTAIALLAGAIALASGFALFGACVPDLEITSLPGVEAGPKISSCGDGFIDIDAGEECDPGEGGAIGCTSRCTIDCPEGGFVDDASMHCYFAPTRNTASFDQAKQLCAQGAHIVSFISDREFNLVFGWALQNGAPFWLGLTNLGGLWIDVETVPDPGWIAGECSGCFAKTDDAGAFARPGDGGFGQCLTTGATAPAIWIAAGCTASRRVVCEREPPGALTELCNGLVCMRLRATYGQKRYVYVDQAMSPDDAAAFCANFPGGRLVVLTSQEERDQLWRELVGLPTPPFEVWIGLSRDDDSGTWHWDDGKSESEHPLQWGEKQPYDAAAGGGSRAYLWLLRGDPEPDSQLARNADLDLETQIPAAPTALPFVCEAPPDTP